MSFSKDVKEELSRTEVPARHCQIAEITAIYSICGHVVISARNKYSVKTTRKILLLQENTLLYYKKHLR